MKGHDRCHRVLSRPSVVRETSRAVGVRQVDGWRLNAFKTDPWMLPYHDRYRAVTLKPQELDGDERPSATPAGLSTKLTTSQYQLKHPPSRA